MTKEQLLAIMEAQRTSATKVPIGRGSAAAAPAGGGRGGHHHHQGAYGRHKCRTLGLGWRCHIADRVAALFGTALGRT